MKLPQTNPFYKIGIVLSWVIVGWIAIVLSPASAAPKNDVDYSLYVSCIDKTASSYTAHFGYVNRGSQSLTVDATSITPQINSVQLPKKLEKGQVDKSFSVSTGNQETITWSATIAGITKTATASEAYPECNPVQTEKKVTICHAAGRAGSSSYITITISWTAAFGQAGHFYENGTPRAGHEQDLLGECPVIEITPGVTTTPAPVNTSVPTAQPSVLGTQTPPPATVQVSAVPTVSPSPTVVMTILQSPLLTPTPTTTIVPTVLLPKDISLTKLPSRPDAIRIPIKVQDKEIFSFNTGSVQFSSNCSESSIVAYYPALSGTNSIAFAEYSIDSGKTWYQVTPNAISQTNGVTSMNIHTRPLADNLYSIALKVQTDSGAVFTSDARIYLHQCQSNAYITSYFIQNGFDVGIKNSQNEYYVNRSLPVSLYVETVGAVNEIIVRSKQSDRTVSLTYDPAEKLWKGDIVNLLDRADESFRLEIVVPAHNIVKQLPVIKTIGTQSSNAAVDEGYMYEVYYQIGDAWEKLPYVQITGILPKSSNGTFSLGAGTYFVRVTYPRKITQITKEFTLTDRSIVTVKTKNNPGMFEALSELSVDITRDNSKASAVIQTVSSVDAVLEQQFTSEIAKNSEFIIVSYWNRWNPRYSEQLPVLEKFAAYNGVRVILLTDENNKEELARLLKYGESSIIAASLPVEYFELPTHFINNDITIYDRSNNVFKVIYDSASLDDVLEEVIK